MHGFVAHFLGANAYWLERVMKNKEHRVMEWARVEDGRPGIRAYLRGQANAALATAKAASVLR